MPICAEPEHLPSTSEHLSRAPSVFGRYTYPQTASTAHNESMHSHLGAHKPTSRVSGGRLGAAKVGGVAQSRKQREDARRLQPVERSMLIQTHVADIKESCSTKAPPQHNS